MRTSIPTWETKLRSMAKNRRSILKQIRRSKNSFQSRQIHRTKWWLTLITVSSKQFLKISHNIHVKPRHSICLSSEDKELQQRRKCSQFSNIAKTRPIRQGPKSLHKETTNCIINSSIYCNNLQTRSLANTGIKCLRINKEQAPNLN